MTEVFHRRFRLAGCLTSAATESDVVRGSWTAGAQGGVDYEGHGKQELYERAAALNVQGRSRMTNS
ncbi:MAG: hypothetical protein ABR922_13895 [Streptosporangiaceae bacterium]|jgi:hypothetical protein